MVATRDSTETTSWMTAIVRQLNKGCKMDKVVFFPVGGADSIGASCYFLKLGPYNIILDCGTGVDSENGVYEPDCMSLLRSGLIGSMGQIGMIVVSHAHLDHVGALATFARCCPNANIYMTELTRNISYYQLYGKRMGKPGVSGDESLMYDGIFDRVQSVGYLRTLDYGDLKVTFYPAGHFPGAMMTLFEYEGRRILYSGDYSLSENALSGKCIIPDGGVDSLILCSVNAVRPYKWHRTSNQLDDLMREIDGVLESGRPVNCVMRQFSKSVELLTALNEAMACGKMGSAPVYISKSVMEVINVVEAQVGPILNANTHLADSHLARLVRASPPFILISTERECMNMPNCMEVCADFTLHDDYLRTVDFICETRPKKVVVVHYSSFGSPDPFRLERNIEEASGVRTSVDFAIRGNKYCL